MCQTPGRNFYLIKEFVVTRRNVMRSALLLGALACAGLPGGASWAAGTQSGTQVNALAAAGATAAAAPDSVLARVNGAAITRAEVERAIAIFLAQSHASHDLSPEARKEAESGALEQLIGAQLLYQGGLGLLTKDLENQVAQRVGQIKAKFPSQSAYDSALKTNNMTEAEAQEIVRRDLVAANLLDKEVVGKIVVSEDDISAFYRQNLDKFSTPDSVQVSHILVEVDPQATAKERSEAREKAETLRGKILAGADFAALAASESACPSKEAGGDIGVFGKGELIPEFEAPVAALKVGEISPVVETSVGYHVLKLTGRTTASVSKLSEVREKIATYLKQTRAQQAIDEYVGALKKKAVIELIAGG